MRTVGKRVAMQKDDAADAEFNAVLYGWKPVGEAQLVPRALPSPPVAGTGPPASDLKRKSRSQDRRPTPAQWFLFSTTRTSRMPVPAPATGLPECPGGVAPCRVRVGGCSEASAEPDPGTLGSPRVVCTCCTSLWIKPSAK